MVEALGHCMICGADITDSFCVCAWCEEQYGLDGPPNNWPAWAQDMMNDWSRQRYAERTALANLDDSEEAASIYDRLCYGESD